MGVNVLYSGVCMVITSPENLVLVPRTDFLPSPSGEGRGAGVKRCAFYTVCRTSGKSALSAPAYALQVLLPSPSGEGI
ncbi:MAG: hypothetical protein LUB59_05105 [Candidatus Gastranaerophilales bacterium]|nr:hypothetical protein [Candidatus Gastranaerophilales bacterium]